MERTVSLPGVTLNWMKTFLGYKVANIWNSFKSGLRQENISKFAKTIRDKAVIYKHYTILVILVVEKGVEQVLISEKREEARKNVVTNNMRKGKAIWSRLTSSQHCQERENTSSRG